MPPYYGWVQAAVILRTDLCGRWFPYQGRGNSRRTTVSGRTESVLFGTGKNGTDTWGRKVTCGYQPKEIEVSMHDTLGISEWRRLLLLQAKWLS